MEEGKLLAAGELVLDGKIPHRDFEHLYGPGDVYAVAVAFAVARPSLGVERAVGVVATLVLLGAVFSIGLHAGRVAATTAAILCGAAILPFGVHAYSWVGGVALAVTGVAAATWVPTAGKRARPVLAAIAGASAALALFYRADLVVGLALAGLVVGPALAPRDRRLALSAFGIALTPYVAHAVLVGPARLFDGMVRDPLFRLRGGRNLPVPPPSDRLAGWLEAVAPEPARLANWTNPARPLQLRLAFFLTIAAVVLVVAVGLVLKRRGWQTAVPVLAPGVLAAGTLPQMLQRADSVHVRFVACVAVALVPPALASLLRGRRRAVAVAAAAGLGVAAAFSLVAPHLAVQQLTDLARTSRSPAPMAVHAGRRFPVHDAQLAREVEEAAAAASSSAGAGGRVFVGATDVRYAAYADTFLYHLLPGLRPASYFLELNPGTVNRRGSGLADDLRRADVLILSSRYSEWEEPNRSTEPGDPEPAAVVARRFRPVARAGPYAVFARRPSD